MHARLRLKWIKKLSDEIDVQMVGDWFYNLNQWYTGTTKKSWPRFAKKNLGKFFDRLQNLAFTTNTLSVLMTPNHGSSLKHWLW